MGYAKHELTPFHARASEAAPQNRCIYAILACYLTMTIKSDEGLKAFGEVLKQLRLERGDSQAVAAVRVGVGCAHGSEWSRPRRPWQARWPWPTSLPRSRSTAST